jgi:uncharacterized integral membrane protein
MRYLYLALIILITIAVGTFTLQNIHAVTVSFLTLSVILPLSLLILGVYLLGMLTGSMVVSTVRSWVHGATKPPPVKQIAPPLAIVRRFAPNLACRRQARQRLRSGTLPADQKLRSRYARVRHGI